MHMHMHMCMYADKNAVQTAPTYLLTPPRRAASLDLPTYPWRHAPGPTPDPNPRATKIDHAPQPTTMARVGMSDQEMTVFIKETFCVDSNFKASDLFDSGVDSRRAGRAPRNCI